MQMGGCSSNNHKGKRHTGDLGSVLANLHHTRKGWLNIEVRQRVTSEVEKRKMLPKHNEQNPESTKTASSSNISRISLVWE